MGLVVVGQECFWFGLKNKDGKIEVGHGKGTCGFYCCHTEQNSRGGWASKLQDGDDKPVLGVCDIVVALSYDANHQDLSQFPARIPCHDPSHLR